MIHNHAPRLVLAMLGLTLAACSEDAITEPSSTEVFDQTALAVATTSNQWVTRADMPSGTRRDLATAVVTNSAGQSVLYAIGGKTPTGGSLSRVQAYNAATNTWSWKASLPVPLYWTNGAGVIGGKIYISGGRTSARGLSFGLYVYDPATNTWARKRDMPNTTFRGITGVINNKLYVLTGCDQEDCQFFDPIAFYRYDPATDQWETLLEPTNWHGWGMGGTIGGKLYVTGGRAALDVYDPATNQWTSRAPMPLRRWMAAGATLGAKLYVIGGFQENADGSIVSGVRTTSVYDPATNSWTNKAPMPTARSGIAASRVVVNGKARLEVVGGARPGNNLAYIP
jgi:N-acetylneuraminic acid mutarotase